eukprot:6210028-Pleurochrysis_carterae.AAC.10
MRRIGEGALRLSSERRPASPRPAPPFEARALAATRRTVHVTFGGAISAARTLHNDAEGDRSSTAKAHSPWYARVH